MPGLYALRSASSSSSSTHAKAHTAASHHQRQGTIFPSAPTPVPCSSRALPAFYTVANPLLVVLTAQPIRFKQTTDPSTDARLHDTSTLNYSSSGSPHDDPNTVCLAAMVHEFLEEEIKLASCGRARCNCVDGVCGDDHEETCTMAEEAEEDKSSDDHLCEILEGITSCTSKPELLLLVDVARAVEVESEELAAIGGDDGAVTERVRRPVMKRLQQEGYNAAICKSRWKHADGLPSGDYEYIDIVMDGKGGSKKQERFIVDIDFRAQFEIARASKQYVQLLGVLPRLFVGRAERLKQILKIMSNAAKCSLKQQGLLLPPWRKHKYMQAKWLSPYRRTTNTDSISSSLQAGSQHLLGLGSRAPKILSLDFTKEMDLLFYKAQLKGLNNIHEHHAHKREANAMNVGIIRTGFAAEGALEHLPSQYIEACISAGTWTDWQLPALDEKCTTLTGFVKEGRTNRGNIQAKGKERLFKCVHMGALKTSSYEDARNQQRLEDNKRGLECTCVSEGEQGRAA